MSLQIKLGTYSFTGLSINGFSLFFCLYVSIFVQHRVQHKSTQSQVPLNQLQLFMQIKENLAPTSMDGENPTEMETGAILLEREVESEEVIQRLCTFFVVESSTLQGLCVHCGAGALGGQGKREPGEGQGQGIYFPKKFCRRK